jgi:hypothetical protein
MVMQLDDMPAAGRETFPEQLLRLALQTLTERSLLWVGTLAGAGAWAAALAWPVPLRLIAAAGYSVLVLWPLLWHSKTAK